MIMRRTAVVLGLAVGVSFLSAAPAQAGPTATCNGDMHTNLWNVTWAKSEGFKPGQVASATAHRDHGLGAVLGWWGPFAATECKG